MISSLLLSLMAYTLWSQLQAPTERSATVRRAQATTTALNTSWRYPDPEGAAIESITVLRSYPHPDGAFTQGLEIEGSRVLESTGIHGRSQLMEWDLKTGKVLKRRQLSRQYFGEGSTRFKGLIYQLTWKAGVGFIYDADRLLLQKRFHYSGEGWGLTHNDSELIMSDGSDTLRFIHPQTLQESRRLRVFGSRGGISKLNELEWIPPRENQPASLLANVWETPYIARISPTTGELLSWIDLRPLWPGHKAQILRGTVPNGIAYDAQSQRLYVTGKLWPRVYAISLSRTGKK